ncbi:hypothetical protein HY448_01470 [Candidatus Pacearchaeota archaeon]|nr:hypothetical protein [Candidatus Pacearchaeota archaeon]
MRKILNREEEERQKKRNQFIVGGVLIFLMIFSTLGYALQSIVLDNQVNSTQQKITYNGFDFTEQNGFWVLNKDSKNFIFRNIPYDVQKIDSEIKNLDNYKNKTLYIFSESVEAESEIRVNLRQFVNKIENACLEEQNCSNISVTKNCGDNFIIIQEKKENELEKIEQNGNCVFIKGQKESLTGLTDEFLFKILGVES